MKKIITLIVISFLAGLLLLLSTDDEILIQSLESRTLAGEPVFNKIKWIKEKNRDIWMMNQSHFGLNANSTQWERLAIIIENNQASFYQLPAGELSWSDELIQKQVPYRATCFMCHNNGPRAIRPDNEGLSINWTNRAKIFFWNLKIKSYGRIIENNKMQVADQTRAVPFRHRTAFDNETLRVETCVKCHKENGFLARGALTRQQVGTIEFMVKNKIMPPVGFMLSKKEEQQLYDFINGY